MSPGSTAALKFRVHQIGGLIQIQAPLYPGDSGAVVANLRGQWLGLIRSGLALPVAASDRIETGRDNDFGFAIAAHDALWVADQLRAHGRVDRAYLGVRLEPDDAPEPETSTGPAQPASDAKRGTETSPTTPLDGAFLYRVLDDTPAAQSGLQAGDSIVALDGRPIRTPHDLTDRLDRLPARAMIRLEIVRGDGPQPRRLALALRTASRPGTPAHSPAPPAVPSGESGSGPSTPKPGLTVVPTAAPAPAATTSTEAPAPAALPSVARPAGSPKPGPGPPAKTGRPHDQALSQIQGGTSPPVSIPAPVRSPLRAAVLPPQAEELGLTLPRAVTERLERLERRLEKLERQPLPTPDARRAGPAARP